VTTLFSAIDFGSRRNDYSEAAKVRFIKNDPPTVGVKYVKNDCEAEPRAFPALV